MLFLAGRSRDPYGNYAVSFARNLSTCYDPYSNPSVQEQIFISHPTARDAEMETLLHLALHQ